MDVKTELEKRIEIETQKIRELKSQLEREEAFVLGLQEALKMLPGIKEKRGLGNSSEFRSGSNVKKAYELLNQSRKPMNITEILIGIGKEDTKANRASLLSSLYRSVKKGRYIEKVDPNTFSVKGLKSESKREKAKEELELPPNFRNDN